MSAHEATGLGAWAAGCASRLAMLAKAIPSYVEAVTICAHSDDAGQRGAHDLADALSKRPIEVRVSSHGDEP